MITSSSILRMSANFFDKISILYNKLGLADRDFEFIDAAKTIPFLS